jgi:hypothetical protein
MANWRDTILKNFTPNISRLTLVADPDGLLTEEGMLSAIKDRGFDLIPFDDAIAFRYAYESQYRSKWDKGTKTDLVVVLRSAEQQLNRLPFDLLRAGRPLTFALHHLFPKLNYPVIAGLDRSYLDAVDEGYQKHDGEQLTERGTKEFVLKKCFGIVADVLNTPVELLRVLLSLHSRKVHLPDFLADYLLENLKKNAEFESWPLAEIISRRESFFRFLQDEWKTFLAAQADPSVSCRVPFGHEDVRAYIDTFFLEGSLTPVEQHNSATLPAWAQTGIKHDPKVDALLRFRRLSKKFEAELPNAGVSYRDWQQAAQWWAELVVLRWECANLLKDADRSDWTELQSLVEDAFGKWMMNRYGSLHNLPYSNQPVMVHQIARFLAVEKTRKKLDKIALLVLDGLAFDQWLLLKKSLETCDGLWRFQESTAFAWVPTLTSVTRQSIFAAEPPLYFPDSLATTSKERDHWLRFWEDHGVERSCVTLVTNIDGPNDPDLVKSLGNARLSVLGIIWNKVDNIMHGMQMQTAGMHDQVRLWASQGHLQQLLTRLHSEGFTVYLTADHGNVTATGVGNPRDGVLAETKGKRVRVYDRNEFLEEVANKFPESLRWPNFGLPPARLVLLPGNLKAFTDVGDEVVSHGGIALEEVMVPFVAISREGT